MITRTELISRIEACIAGALDDTALAAWAFDRFYAVELEEETIAEADSVLISEILDELIFADEQAFALSSADLIRLLERLRAP